MRIQKGTSERYLAILQNSKVSNFTNLKFYKLAILQKYLCCLWSEQCRRLRYMAIRINNTAQRSFAIKRKMGFIRTTIVDINSIFHKCNDENHCH